MKELNWNSFTKKIYIKSSAEKLYQCWTTSEGLESWFLKKAVFTRSEKDLKKNEVISVGDHYTWFWHNWDGQEKGEILEVKPNESLIFSFADTCRVIITFETVNDAVLVSLTQDNIPTDDANKLKIFYGCSNGWTFWLANLKAYLEHNILLNETHFDLTNIDLSGFEFVNM